jgi:hypothetical protein
VLYAQRLTLGITRDGVLLDFFECLLNIARYGELRTEASSRDEVDLEIC